MTKSGTENERELIEIEKTQREWVRKDGDWMRKREDWEWREKRGEESKKEK